MSAATAPSGAAVKAKAAIREAARVAGLTERIGLRPYVALHIEHLDREDQAEVLDDLLAGPWLDRWTVQPSVAPDMLAVTRYGQSERLVVFCSLDVADERSPQ